MWLTGHSKDQCFGAGNLKIWGAQVYTAAEGLFATNKDLGGSSQTKNAGGMCVNQGRSQSQSRSQSQIQ